MNKETDNIDRLLKDIERYFDCKLTDDEEAALRLEIAHTDIKHPAVDEARAVMGFGTIRSHAGNDKAPVSKKYVTFRTFRMAAGIAASILLIFNVGYFLGKHALGKSDQECIAFVNGERITDEDEVLKVMMQSVNELDEGIVEVREETGKEMGPLLPLVDFNELFLD